MHKLAGRGIMIKWILLSAAAFVAGNFWISYASAGEVLTHVTVNEKNGYRSTSSGDPLTSGGARVVVSNEGVDGSAYGGIMYKTQSKGWSTRKMQLSATIATTAQDAKPALWLRAQDRSGKVLRFVSSASLGPLPKSGQVGIEMRAPADTDSVAFGLVMRGSGRITADRLTLSHSISDASENDASAKDVYEEAEKVVFQHAYWARNLQGRSHIWETQLSSERGSGYQAEVAIRELLNDLKDSHSFYRSAEESRHSAMSGADPNSVKVRLIEEKFGYVLMPSVGGTDRAMAESFANEVGGRLKQLSEEARCGWIVDLRENTGGNMWPMISSLGLFFDNGRLGGFKGPDGRVTWWSLQSPSATPVLGRSDAQDARVSVLVGPRTSSSGEAVAVAFVGRKNTRIFGSPSSGKASANRRFSLADGSSILLTTEIDVDRFGREFGERIIPDVRLPDDVVAREDVPDEAVSWLASSCAD
ncbi:S41 family peptidase [Stenotrophomonas maltophilia]|uniref:S41 family peptidase n=1 Tax=Stenotrophomonas maltophilia TaxID=40324 RepID=UPI003BF8F425